MFDPATGFALIDGAQRQWTYAGTKWTTSGQRLAGNPEPSGTDSSAMLLWVSCTNKVRVPAEPTEFVNWTWSETDCPTTTHCQTVQDCLIDGVSQGSYKLSNGFNNSTATFRVPTAGGTVNESGKYLPCTEGVPIAFECDLQSDPGGNAELVVNWYAFGSSTVLSTSTIVPFQSWGAFEHVTATLTPPTGAAKWNLFLRGLLDNVTAAS